MFNVCKGSIRRKIYLLPKFEKHLPDYNRVPLPYKTYLCDETLKHMAFFLSTFITVYEISDEAVLIVQTKHFKYTYFQPESSLLSFVLDLLSCSHSFGVHCSLADHFKVILDRDMYTDCAGRSTIFTLKKTFQKISLSGRWRDLIDTGERRQKNIKSLEV